MKWTEERELLLGSDWFRPLPAEIVAQLAAMTSRRRYANDELIHARGDAPDGLYCVLSGGVRTSTTSSDGRELLLMRFAPGSWFGEIAMFDGLGRTHDSRAVGDAEILLLPRDRFLALLDEQPRLYAHFMKMLCRKLRLAFAYIEDVQFEPLAVRLARRLLDLLSLYGASEKGVIELQFSQDELARTLGASRQAISRELKAWEAREWIGLSYGGLAIHQPEALRQIADHGQM